MPFKTITVGVALGSTALSTWFSHYFTNRPPPSKPTSRISYHQGLSVIRRFLYYASHQTVEDFQSFTGRSVPSATWAKTTNVVIPPDYLVNASYLVINQLGPDGISKVGGNKWWQWRGEEPAYRAQWIETRADYNERRNIGTRAKRVILYLHGGAYYFGSADTHRYQLQRHARKLKARVFARLHDSIAAYLFLLDIHKPEEIIIAGDSSGGGLALSVLVTLRDQKVPLPAGGVLISPWVDLMHSFPSVTAGCGPDDYLPEYSFMHKPSMAWPPPNTDEIGVITKSAKQILDTLNFPPGDHSGKRVDQAIENYFTRRARSIAQPGPLDPLPPSQAGPGTVDPAEIPFIVQIDGRRLQIKDQIHMYTTNHLLSHPLVSPVLQPSLGGLPPLMVTVGGGEMLRDEQIYLAHKAANPERYPPSEKYLNLYDPTRRLVSKYPPTNVQLQVWDDLCHVPTTLSFTHPAKLMFRAIAQFQAWAFSHAQDRSIDIRDGDEDEDEDTNRGPLPLNYPKSAQAGIDTIGKAGDPLPPFHQHMIRQRIDRHGNIHPLPVEAAIPALNIRRDDIGEAKEEPLRRWMMAKQYWDAKYAKLKKKIQERRIEELLIGIEEIEPRQTPPPTSLAARRGISIHRVREAPGRKSRALAFWNNIGAKDDSKRIRKEGKELYEAEMPGASKFRWRPGSRNSFARASRVSRASYTRTVTDTGQANEEDNGIDIQPSVQGPSEVSPRGTYHPHKHRREPEIAVYAPPDEGYADYEPQARQRYVFPDSTIPETPLDRQTSYLGPPAIPERSPSRLEADKTSTRAIRGVEGVIPPRPESSSSQIEWETPRESISYIPRRTFGELDATTAPVPPPLERTRRLQVSRTTHRHHPVALAPILNGQVTRPGLGADADASTRSIYNASGVIPAPESGSKGKEIAYDLQSFEQDRVPSETEPFPPYSINGTGDLSKAPSGYSSEYSVHA